MQEVILKKLPSYDQNDFVYKYTVGCTDMDKKITAPDLDLVLFECSTNLKEHDFKLDVGISQKKNTLIARRDDEFFEVSSTIKSQLFNAIKDFSDLYKITKKSGLNKS
jgi:hypothetical protein